jgi:hypothetical protein
MIVAVAPVYIDQAHRFVSNVGPKSLAKVSEDSGVSVEALTKFQDDKKALSPEDCVRVWSTVFKDMSHLQAHVFMNEQGFE